MAEIGKLLPQWEALAGPDNYIQALQAASKATVTVERLKPFYAHEDRPALLDPDCTPG